MDVHERFLLGPIVAMLAILGCFSGCQDENSGTLRQNPSSINSVETPAPAIKTDLLKDHSNELGPHRSAIEERVPSLTAMGEISPPSSGGPNTPRMSGENVEVITDWNDVRNVQRHRAVASLSDGECTGVAVSPYHVLTAAHCVDADEGSPERADNITFGTNNNDPAISCNFVENDEYSHLHYSFKSGNDCENSAYPSILIDGETAANDGIALYPDWIVGHEHHNDLAIIRLRHGLRNYPSVHWFNAFSTSELPPSSIVTGDIASPHADDLATMLGHGRTCEFESPEGNPGTEGPLRFGWDFNVENIGDLFHADGKHYGEGVWACPGDSGAPVFDSVNRLIGINRGRPDNSGDDYNEVVNLYIKASWIQSIITADDAEFDNDEDTFYDYDDVCPDIYSRVVDDIDNDDIPDACDPCSAGGYNGPEGFFAPICAGNPYHYNCLHENMDTNVFSGVSSDSSDPNWWYEDADSDHVPNACDNCWDVPNPDQADTNGNSETSTGVAFLNTGDACDSAPSLALSGDGIVTSVHWGDKSKFGCSRPAPLVRVDFATVGKSTDTTTQNAHVMMAWCDCDGFETGFDCKNQQCLSGQPQLKMNRMGYYPMTHEPDGYYSSSESFDATSVNLTTNRFENMSTTCGTPGDVNDSDCFWPATWPDENDFGMGWTGLDAELCSRQEHPFAPAVKNEEGMSWRWQQELWWKKRATIADAQTPLLELDPEYSPLGTGSVTWWGWMWFQAAQYDSSLMFDVPFSIAPPNCEFNWVAKPIFSIYDYIPNFEDPCQGCPEVVDSSLWDIYSHLIISGRSDSEGQFGKFSFPYETIQTNSAISSLRVAMFDRQTGVEKGEAYSVFPDGVAIGESSFAAARFGWSESGLQQLLQQTLAPLSAEPQSTAFALFGGEDAAGALSDRLWLGLAYGEDEDRIPYVSWQQVPSSDIAPEARKGAALVFDSAGQRLLLFGGEGETGLLSDLWAYDLSAGGWSEIEVVGDAPSGLAGTTVVPWHDRAFLVGGTTSSGPSDAIYSIDRETGEFARLVELSDGPGARTHVSAAIHQKDRALYLYGGELDGVAQNDLWRFDLARWTWEQLAPSSATGEVPEASTSNLLLTGRLQGGGVFVYTGSDLNSGMPYWRWGGDHWITDLENEPWSDFDADGIPNSQDNKHALLVADGYYVQEQQIENHLETVNGYEIDVKKASQITGTTPLGDYDLIVISEFAPGISTAGRNNISASHVPLLIVEYWDFWYSYKFGLTTSSSCGYYGKTMVRTVTQSHPITSGLGDLITVYSPSYTIYGINKNSVKSGVTKLVYNSNSTTANEIAVLADDTKGIVATGIYDTRKYTAAGWNLFDRCVAHLETFNE